MALSARERLHQLIDKLPDDKVINLLDDLEQVNLPENDYYTSVEELEQALNARTEAQCQAEQEAALKWLQEADKLREEIFAKHGKYFDNQSVLDEIREEPTDERLGRK